MHHPEPAKEREASESLALDDERIDKGLQVAFGDVTPEVKRYRSVVQQLSSTTGEVSGVSPLVDVDDEPGPLLRPRGESDDLPAQIGRYRIAGEVARGGIGAIYKARDEDLGRDVALKVLLRDSQRHPEMTQRFLEEAQIGAQLQHPGLVPVHELGLFAGERPFFAMKLVKGKTLGRLLAERASPSDERLRFLGIFEQICQPLAYAHARGVIHRDLKPSNVMVGAFGEVQVMDWGLAKVLVRGGLADDRIHGRGRSAISVIETVRSGSSTGGSVAGSVFGTPAYMAPEQARGQIEALDERTDVFGLGAILCEIVTGEPPYIADTNEELQRLAKRGDLDDAMARLDRSGADREVIDLARRCLAFEPRNRPQDARAVARDVRAYLESLEERARRVELNAAKTRFRATAAALLVFALGAASVSYLLVDREREQTRAASKVRIERAVAEARLRVAEAEVSGSGASGWAAALEAVVAADALLTPGGAREPADELESLRRRIETETRAQELVAELGAIRDDALYGAQSYTLYDSRYSVAFARFLAAEIDSLTPAQIAERVRRTRSAPEIVLALDDWALLRRELRRPHDLLRDASLAVDADRGRARMWQLIEASDSSSIERFLQATEGERVSASVLSLLADSLSRAGSDSTAEQLLRRALETEPDSFRANIRLGGLLAERRVGRAREALPYLFAARVLRPRNKCPHRILASAYFDLELPDQALGHVSSALELGPGDDWCIGNCVAHLETEGASFSPATLDRFVRSVETAIAAGTVSQRGWEALGAARARRAAGGQASEVLAQAEADAARTGRSNPYILNMLARVQFAAGDPRSAVRTLEEAMALSSDLPGWSRLLAAWRRKLLPEIVSFASVDAALDEPDVLVAEGAEWRYFRGTELPSAGFEWTSPGYDDESWEVGPSGFGYGDGDDRTVLADMQGNYWSLYVRREIEIEDPSRFRRVLLQVIADDAFAAYVNGELAGAVRMDPQNLALAAPAAQTPEPVAPVAIDLSGKLRAGSNVIAIRALNADLRSTDFSLIPELFAEPVREPAQAALRVEKLREKLESRGEKALAAYLAGRWLERTGELALAAERFHEVVRIDRRSSLPFQRLWEVLGATQGREAARRIFRDVIEQGLPQDLIRAPLDPPRELRAVDTEGGVELSTIGLPWHPDPRVRISWTRWQVRAEGGDYDHTAVLDITQDGDMARVFVPRHRLPPRSVHHVKASWHVEGAGYAASDEQRFTTGDYPFEVIPIDLAAHFDADLVVNPGDAENRPVDGQGGYFLVDGYDGRRAGNANAQGLPVDGVVGIHRLADYDGPNAIHRAAGHQITTRINVPARRYSALRFVAVSGHGDGELPLTFIYSDGTRERGVLHVDDWFDDPGAALESERGRPSPDSTPLLNGLDRLVEGQFADVNDAAVFETTITVDPRKELVSFELGFLDPQAQEAGTCTSVFAVTGVWTGDR